MMQFNQETLVVIFHAVSSSLIILFSLCLCLEKASLGSWIWNYS